MPVEELRDEPMMSHLIDSLEAKQDVGHYGRLAFAIVARHFLGNEEIVSLLANSKGCDEEQARSLLKQVEARGYNPPKRERILEWQQKQDFPICENPDDAAQCNVYRNLEFPQEVYRKIAEYYEQQPDNG